MPRKLSLSRCLAVAWGLTACGATPDLHAAVLGTPQALETADLAFARQVECPAECQGLHERIVALDLAIERHPEVRAMRQAYDNSPAGQRERAAMQALNTERCFAQSSDAPSGICLTLMQEIDACASAFESSPAFLQVRALPEVVEIERLSERFSDLCADTFPGANDGPCGYMCQGESDDESSCGDDGCGDDQSCEEYDADGEVCDAACDETYEFEDDDLCDDVDPGMPQNV